MTSSRAHAGHYIVIEGLDGSGKTTQFERLLKTFPDFVGVREPGGTPMAERMRMLIKDASIERTGRTNAFLFAAARADLIDTIVRPMISQGKTVISDRNWLSTIAYQAAEGAPIDDLLALNRLCAKEFFEPDLTILIDIDVPAARQRLGARGGRAIDYFERKGDEYFEAIRTAYHTHVSHLPNHEILDGNQPIEVIAGHIRKLIQPFVARPAAAQ